MDTWTADSGAGEYPAQNWGTNADPTCEAKLTAETGPQWFRQRIRDLRSHPDFAATAVDLARSMVQLFEGRYLVNKAMANVARQTVCIAILSSYFGQTEQNGGTFLSTIQRLTTAMRVCSKNTTAATVALLERLGLVVRVKNDRDRRWLHIQPTEDLVAAARDYQRILLTAADTLFPSRNYRASFEVDRGIEQRCFAVGLYSHIAVHTSVFSSARSQVFMDADGGAILLFKLLSLKGKTWQSGDAIVEFPFDEIGSLFGLSRTHVRRLMRKAEAAGFVRLLQKGGRQVRILQPLEDLFENIVAASVARAQLDMQLAMAEDLPAARFG
jgi:DNA-binding MarR family transcriptional regulator